VFRRLLQLGVACPQGIARQIFPGVREDDTAIEDLRALIEGARHTLR